MNFGELDGGSPIDEVRRGVKIIANNYAAMNAETNFSYYIEEGAGHVLSPVMWDKTKSHFERHLKS